MATSRETPTAVTANASFSSVGSLPDALRVDLAAAGALPPLPRAFLGGSDLDLLSPLRFLPAARLPALPALPAVTPALPGAPGAAGGRAAAAGRSRAELAAALLASNRAYGNPNAEHACR